MISRNLRELACLMFEAGILKKKIQEALNLTPYGLEICLGNYKKLKGRYEPENIPAEEDDLVDLMDDRQRRLEEGLKDWK